jgi:hypothetical protein
MNESQPSIHALRALGEAFDELGPRVVDRRGWTPRKVAVAVALAGLVTAAAITPPGRALAERFGDLIGIENYGGHSGVIGTGKTPNDHPYRLVLQGSPTPGETCVFLGFPEVQETGMGTCLGDLAAPILATDKLYPGIYRAPDGILPNGDVVVQGLATADVARVEISFTGKDGARQALPAQTTAVTEDLLKQAGLSDSPFQFFFAFLPPGAVQSPVADQTASDLRDIAIRAYDADGVRLAETHFLDGPDQVRLAQKPLGSLPSDEGPKR